MGEQANANGGRQAALTQAISMANTQDKILHTAKKLQSHFGEAPPAAVMLGNWWGGFSR